MTFNPNIKPGVLEIYTGPMFSGKTQELIHRVQKIQYMENSEIEFFKPDSDKRNQGYIYSRGTNIHYSCITIPFNEPEQIYVNSKNKQVIVIDETQFFSKTIVDVVENLMKENKNVILAGLDLDYRGKPFGPMPELMSIANSDIKKYAGICMSCKKNPGTRTQLLLYGKPAPFDLNTNILPQDLDDETVIKYEVRCLSHHEVPGKLN